MDDFSLDDLAIYLRHERCSHEESAAVAKAMAEHLHYKFGITHVRDRGRGLGQPGWNVGSCSKVEFSFDADWSSVAFDDVERTKYTMVVAASNRGPFVTSSACEVFRAKDGSLPPYQSRASEVAALRCMKYAEDLAVRFQWTYLDPNKLRAIELDEEKLIDDAVMSVDYSEPTAMNILFDEHV